MTRRGLAGLAAGLLLAAQQASAGPVCAPKAEAPVVQTSGQELKLVYPQATARPERFAHLDFERFWLQPMDGPDQVANTAAAIEYCLTHPQWRLSVQTHKYIGVR